MRILRIDEACVLAIAVTLVATAGCKRKNQEGPQVHAQTTLTAADKALAPNDGQVTEAVRKELELDPTLRGGRVSVSTTNGIVNLAGAVDNLLAKDRATRHAEAVRGVRTVDNRIAVHAAHVADDVLARNVKDGLHRNAATEENDVRVTVKDGVVTLAGSANSYAEWAAAERVASRTRGVMAVVNQIEIAHEPRRPDEQIADDVRERLRWDVIVDGRLVLTQVKDGHVWLGGVVGTAAAKRRAAADAWVAGVSGVDASAVEIEPWARRDELRSDTNPSMPDADVERAIRNALRYDPRLRDAAVVMPTVTSGLVTLRGTVPSLDAKLAAGQLAKHTIGVLDVDNRILVDPAKKLSDIDTAQDVMAALGLNPYTNKSGILAQASRGKVTLTGTVESFFQKAEAEQVASSVHGVKAIENQLAVAKPEVGFVYDPHL